MCVIHHGDAGNAVASAWSGHGGPAEGPHGKGRLSLPEKWTIHMDRELRGLANWQVPSCVY